MERQSKSLLIKYLNEVINIIPESVGDVSNELLNQSNNYFLLYRHYNEAVNPAACNVKEFVTPLKCLSVTDKVLRIHSGKKEPDKCLPCILDRKCKSQGSHKNFASDQETTTEKVLKDNFGYEIGVTALSYLEEINSEINSFENYKKWNEYYHAFMTRISEMPMCFLLDKLYKELDSLKIAYDIRFNVNHSLKELNFLEKLTDQENELLYYIFQKNNLSLENTLIFLKLDASKRSSLGKRWRKEGKELKQNNRTFNCRDFFKAYLKYLEPGNDISSISDTLFISHDTAYEVLRSYQLIAKARQKRAAIFEIESDEEIIMSFFNNFLTEDVTLQDLASREESPYKEKTLDLKFKGLINKYQQHLKITPEDYERYKREVRIFTTRNPILSLTEIISLWQQSPADTKNSEGKVDKNALYRNLKRLRILEFQNYCKRPGEIFFLLMRNGGEYGILDSAGCLVKISKIEFKILDLLIKGTRDPQEIHKLIWPFHWTRDYDYETFQSHLDKLQNYFSQIDRMYNQESFDDNSNKDVMMSK
jgi:hypothetical protein